MYQCLKPESEWKDQAYCLLSIRPEDTELVRQWRNAQKDVLRQQKILLPLEQQHYFESQIFPTFSENYPKQILMSFLLEESCIGYGGLTNIDWNNQRAEISFLLNPLYTLKEKEYAEKFSCFLSLLSHLAFEKLNLHRLYTETFAFRLNHIKILEKENFKREGSLRDHIYKKGCWWDSIFHGKLKKEWKSDAK